MIFFGCQEDSALSPVSDQNDQVPASLAKKPAPNLIGTTYTPFTFTPPTFWNGTIDFGVYGKYSITFVSHDAPREYSQASPFHEDFIIYELGADWTQPETVVSAASKKNERKSCLCSRSVARKAEDASSRDSLPSKKKCRFSVNLLSLCSLLVSQPSTPMGSRMHHEGGSGLHYLVSSPRVS